MVRCGSLYDLTLVNKKDIDSKTGLTPQQQLNAIFKATSPLYTKRDEIFEKINKKLRKHYNIINYKFDELNMVRKEYATKYFYDNVLPILSPQIIDQHQPFPHLTNKNLYIYSILEIPNDNVEEGRRI